MAGYRGYTDADNERLHVVLVYRSVGLALDEIRTLLDDPATDVLAHRYYDDVEPGLAQFVHDVIMAR